MKESWIKTSVVMFLLIFEDAYMSSHMTESLMWWYCYVRQNLLNPDLLLQVSKLKAFVFL